MWILLVILAGVVLLDIAALLWGANSGDNVNSAEWERRQNWPGFH
jgi:hypothetical protein